MFYKSNTSAWKESPGRNHRYTGLCNDYGPDLFHLFVLSMVCGGKVPVVPGRQKADEHHQDCAQYHGGVSGEPAVQADIADSPGNGGGSIYMLAQDIRGLAGQNIPEGAASHACKDAQEHGEKMIFPVTSGSARPGQRVPWPPERPCTRKPGS